MDGPTHTDNGVSPTAERVSGPDPHGQAAMLLVESLIHSLIARSVISVSDAVEIVRAAAEVKIDIGDELGDSPATMEKSLLILWEVQASMSIDLADK